MLQATEKHPTTTKAEPFDVEYSAILSCIHCGMCLPTCPTYAVTGDEKHSPRGRIQMMRAIATGELEVSDTFADSMHFCLGCYACETACPAGVDYSRLFEAARHEITKHRPNKLRDFILGKIFTSDRRLKWLARMLRFGKRSGFQKLAARTGLLRLVSRKLEGLEPMAPVIDRRFSDQIISAVEHPEEPARYRVGFIKGCIMNVAFAGINRQTVDVLLHNRCEVHMPADQQCCASLHAHNGDMDTAAALAKTNIAAFEAALSLEDYDAIIINAAGCGAFLKEYGHVLKDDPEWAERATTFSRKVKDISEFVADIEYAKPQHTVKVRATYHDACHLCHGQGITLQPRMLMQAIPGLELVPLKESTWCCGSAGIYNILNYDASMGFLRRKMRHIKDSGATMVITGNPGCMLQIEEGVRQENMQGVEVVHPVTLLHRGYFGDGGSR